MTGIAHAVASGVAYRVTSVADGQEPVTLGQFVGDAEFTVEMAAETYRVCGSGIRPDDAHVRFHEKDDLSKDVRVWHVTAADDGGFRAEHVAAF